MANALYGQILYADTVGILSKTPVHIMGVNFVPDDVSDTFDLNWWDEANATASSELNITATASSGTVTDDDSDHDYLTSSAFADGSVVKVIQTAGAAGNRTYHLVGTAGNDDRIIITPTSTWADESNIMYHIINYPARPFLNGLQPTATDTHYSMYWYFGPQGVYLPNLVLESISTSAYLQIYLASKF